MLKVMLTPFLIAEPNSAWHRHHPRLGSWLSFPLLGPYSNLAPTLWQGPIANALSHPEGSPEYSGTFPATIPDRASPSSDDRWTNLNLTRGQASVCDVPQDAQKKHIPSLWAWQGMTESQGWGVHPRSTWRFLNSALRGLHLPWGLM